MNGHDTLSATFADAPSPLSVAVARRHAAECEAYPRRFLRAVFKAMELGVSHEKLLRRSDRRRWVDTKWGQGRPMPLTLRVLPRGVHVFAVRG